MNAAVAAAEAGRPRRGPRLRPLGSRDAVIACSPTGSKRHGASYAQARIRQYGKPLAAALKDEIHSRRAFDFLRPARTWEAPESDQQWTVLSVFHKLAADTIDTLPIACLSGCDPG